MDDIFKLEEEFFSNPIYLSYSGLSRMEYSPAAFYKHYVLKQREDTDTQASIEGSLVHCLLLEPEKFEEKYIICNIKFPSDNVKRILDTLFSYSGEKTLLTDCEEEILSLLAQFDLYQSMKDPVKLSKIQTEDNQIYFNYLHMSKGKIIITQEVYESANEVVGVIRNNVSIAHYLGLVTDPAIEGFSEIGLQTEGNLEGYLFGLRGFLDRLVINHNEKIIYINDFKKTTKTLKEFKESIDYYHYWIQAVVYIYLVADFMTKYPDVAEYDVQFRFIVIDKYLQAGVYRPSDNTLKSWTNDVKKLLNEANYYIENRNFADIHFINDFVL